MKYQVGDLLVTKNFGQNVIHVVTEIEIENDVLWTEWYNPYSKQIIETRYSINNLKYYTHWIHYQVKQ